MSSGAAEVHDEPPTIPAVPTTESNAPFTAPELRIAKYINELGSRGIRSWASGVLVQDYRFTLWFADRLGTVKSCSFDFIEEPHYLVLFLAAIMSAPFQDLGFCSLMKLPPRMGSEELLDRFGNATLDLPNATVDGTTYTQLAFSPDISANRPFIPSHGSLGRATTVVPVKGTGVTADMFGDERLVAKMSWIVYCKTGEDVAIRAIRKGLAGNASTKKFLENVVDMKCSAMLTIGQMDHPRARLLGLTQAEERVCRVLVLKEYLPLNMVKNVRQFAWVFIDVVRGECVTYD